MRRKPGGSRTVSGRSRRTASVFLLETSIGTGELAAPVHDGKVRSARDTGGVGSGTKLDLLQEDSKEVPVPFDGSWS